MPLKPLCLLATLAAFPAAAADMLTCSGSDPNWLITLSDDTAEFRYLKRSSTFSVPHRVAAQGNPDTTAYTLIGDTDTAILLVNPATCNSQSHQAHVMTQDKGAPVLLAGCCTKSPQ